MIKVLFVCHGNICRSPMAEFILKDMIAKRHLSSDFSVASAATSTEEIGNAVYPPARKILSVHGISCEGKTARQVRRADYEAYDHLIVMDDWNVRNLMRIIGSDPEGKVRRLLDFTNHPGEIDDPWYTRDFDGVYRQIEAGCRAFLKSLGYEE